MGGSNHCGLRRHSSNSLQWMLHILAKHPDIQTVLSEEAWSLGGYSGALMTIKQSCAFVKEMSCLYPTAQFLTRILDHMISLAGYTLPAEIPVAFAFFATSPIEDVSMVRWCFSRIDGHAMILSHILKLETEF